MKINKKSWHYRFLRAVDANIPTSLCPYFWKTVWVTMLTSAIITPFVVVMYAMGDKLLVSLGITFVSKITWIIASTLVGTVAIAGIVATIFGAVFGFFWAKENFKPPYKEEPMIISFIKAKKSKICPTLEFVDENDK